MSEFLKRVTKAAWDALCDSDKISGNMHIGEDSDLSDVTIDASVDFEAAIRAAIAAMRTADIIELFGEDQIVGLVMKLTGGSVNPNVVRGQIERARAALAPEEKAK